MEDINKKIDSIIDWLTEPDGGNAVTESDIREAIVELKELRELKNETKKQVNINYKPRH